MRKGDRARRAAELAQQIKYREDREARDRDDEGPRLCTCGDCGREFRYGSEGDNEKFCLKCEHLSRINRMSPEEREYYEIFGDETEGD